MYLLVATAASWLILLGSFCVTWVNLASPRTTTDLAVLVLVGAATLAFSRIGVVSLLTLLLRLLPDGRLRSTLSSALMRTVPTVLRSSVLAAVSATVAVQAVQAAPAVPARAEPTSPPRVPDHVATSPRVPAAVAHSPAPSPVNDPSWPTAPGRSAESDAPASHDQGREDPETPAPNESPAPDEAAAPNETAAPQETESPKATGAQNPGWPTTPGSTDETPDSPDETPGSTDEESPSSDPPAADAVDPPPAGADETPASSEDDSAGSYAPSGPTSVRVVREGENLWTIAADLSASPDHIRELVADIYADNRDVIGPDPNLIMPGQRLEIEP